MMLVLESTQSLPTRPVGAEASHFFLFLFLLVREETLHPPQQHLRGTLEREHSCVPALNPNQRLTVQLPPNGKPDSFSCSWRTLHLEHLVKFGQIDPNRILDLWGEKPWFPEEAYPHQATVVAKSPYAKRQAGEKRIQASSRVTSSDHQEGLPFCNGAWEKRFAHWRSTRVSLGIPLPSSDGNETSGNSNSLSRAWWPGFPSPGMNIRVTLPGKLPSPGEVLAEGEGNLECIERREMMTSMWPQDYLRQRRPIFLFQVSPGRD